MFVINKKFFTVAATYIIAFILVLGVYSYVNGKNLESFRNIAQFSSQQAFEETVNSVSHMSQNLKKAAYATDRAMCTRLCSQVYADAMAAESAMSTLPFATHELEQISGFLNQTGDYAYYLCCSSNENGFSEEETANMIKLSDLSAQLNNVLLTMQRDFHDGNVDMDSRELKLRNVDIEQRDKISAGFLQFEDEFPQRDALSYDGKYSFKAQETSAAHSSDAQMLAAAARFAGVSPGQLTLIRTFEDGSGRKVYSAGEVQICVGAEGVLNMAQSRLIETSAVSVEKAAETAAEFLENLDYKDLVLAEKVNSGNTAAFKFIAAQDGALCLDNYIKISVALDDESIYTFDADNYSAEKAQVSWDVSEIEAAGAIPDCLEEQKCDRTIIRSEGGRDLACYDFECINEAGDSVTIRVSAATGKQTEIII